MSTEFDLVDYLEQQGGKPGKAGSDEWLLICPQCGKPKLSVSVDQRRWHCWVCERYETRWDGTRRAIAGAGGLIGLVELLEGCSRDRARQKVYGSRLSLDLLALEEEGARDLPSFVSPRIEPPEGWQPIAGLYGPLTYLEKRGITMEDVRLFGLVWCPWGRYAGRVIFPVWEHGRLVYFQGRALRDARPGENFLKALNPPRGTGVGASEVLMNLEVARTYPRVAIVEGPIDCIHAGPSAVCTFGKRITPIQILKLKRAGVRAIDLMWDGPSATEPEGAWPEMRAAAPMLAGLFNLRLVFLPSGDPGSRPRAEIDAYRSQARSASGMSRLAFL